MRIRSTTTARRWRSSTRSAAPISSKWFDERAKRGQFVEAGSPSYQGDSIAALFNLRDFAEDAVLRTKADMYLDLAYADIAEETLLTTRGGPKSRVKVGHEYDGDDRPRLQPALQRAGPHVQAAGRGRTSARATTIRRPPS